MTAWLAPHLKGLIQGAPIARRCGTCGHVSIPPLRHCPQGHATGEWITLANRATIIHRTTGQDGDFALVQFEGADTMTLARIDLPPGATRGVLRPNTATPPALILLPEDTTP